MEQPYNLIEDIKMGFPNGMPPVFKDALTARALMVYAKVSAMAALQGEESTDGTLLSPLKVGKLGAKSIVSSDQAEQVDIDGKMEEYRGYEVVMVDGSRRNLDDCDKDEAFCKLMEDALDSATPMDTIEKHHAKVIGVLMPSLYTENHEVKIDGTVDVVFQAEAYPNPGDTVEIFGYTNEVVSTDDYEYVPGAKLVELDGVTPAELKKINFWRDQCAAEWETQINQANARNNG